MTQMARRWDHVVEREAKSEKFEFHGNVAVYDGANVRMNTPRIHACNPVTGMNHE